MRVARKETYFLSGIDLLSGHIPAVSWLVQRILNDQRGGMMDMGPGSSRLECGHDQGEQFWSWSHKLVCCVPSTRCLPSPEWQQMGDNFNMPFVLFLFVFDDVYNGVHSYLDSEWKREAFVGRVRNTNNSQVCLVCQFDKFCTFTLCTQFVGVMFSSWTVEKSKFLDSMHPKHVFLQDRKPSISLYFNLFRLVWTLFYFWRWEVICFERDLFFFWLCSCACATMLYLLTNCCIFGFCETCWLHFLLWCLNRMFQRRMKGVLLWHQQWCWYIQYLTLPAW